jgi:hypothetical protein
LHISFFIFFAFGDASSCVGGGGGTTAREGGTRRAFFGVGFVCGFFYISLLFTSLRFFFVDLPIPPLFF